MCLCYSNPPNTQHSNIPPQFLDFGFQFSILDLDFRFSHLRSRFAFILSDFSSDFQISKFVFNFSILVFNIEFSIFCYAVWCKRSDFEFRNFYFRTFSIIFCLLLIYLDFTTEMWGFRDTQTNILKYIRHNNGVNNPTLNEGKMFLPLNTRFTTDPMCFTFLGIMLLLRDSMIRVKTWKMTTQNYHISPNKLYLLWIFFEKMRNSKTHRLYQTT